MRPFNGPRSSVEWVVEAPQIVDLIRNPLPIDRLDFRNLDAQGETRRVERFTFGSGRHSVSPSNVANLGELMHKAFTVRWA